MTRRRYFRIPGIVLLAAILWVGVSGTPKANDKSLVLSVAANTVDTLISEVILRVALNRVGIDVTYNKRLPRRALQSANSGVVDGDAQRIDGLSSEFPNLIQLRPAINYIFGSAFSVKSDIEVSGWQDLEPYRVGIIRGIKFAERGTAGMDTVQSSGYPTLFDLLLSDRVDIAVTPSLNGRYQLKAQGIESVFELTPPLQRFDLFLYLHKKHADLVPSIEAEFAKMEANGELAAIRSHVSDVLLAQAERGEPICDRDYACFDPLPLVAGE